jgi:hypothetical protein
MAELLMTNGDVNNAKAEMERVRMTMSEITVVEDTLLALRHKHASITVDGDASHATSAAKSSD